ncbi:hypothetical protein BI344_09640 [Chromobacterium sphagni]|uniref:Transposase DDE domain-containing protein n=1 Tax=Chromobacterium sphagni TaxID=1903179 RepID=A0ABX3CB71_9NEIS|nr:hypothetical protein BI344_09640 [Chromobacterium sphagni]
MTKSAPKRYRTTNWKGYNQALIQRGFLSIWLDTSMTWQARPQGKKGRSQTYSDAAIQFCLTVKNLFRLALRQTPLAEYCASRLASTRDGSLFTLKKPFGQMGRKRPKHERCG